MTTSRKSVRWSFAWFILSSLVVLTLMGPIIESNIVTYQKIMLVLTVVYFVLSQAEDFFDVRTKYYKEMIDRATRRMGK